MFKTQEISYPGIYLTMWNKDLTLCSICEGDHKVHMQKIECIHGATHSAIHMYGYKDMFMLIKHKSE